MRPDEQAAHFFGGDAQIRTGGRGFAGPCLTTWPRRRRKRQAGQPAPQSHGADNGVRTRDPHLGKVVLYQLSHVRVRESTIRKTAHSCKREFQLFSNSLATCNFSRDDVTSQRFVLCTLQLSAFKPTTRPKKWKPRNGSRSIGSPRHPDSQNDPRVRPRRWRPLE